MSSSANNLISLTKTNCQFKGFTKNQPEINFGNIEGSIRIPQGCVGLSIDVVQASPIIEENHHCLLLSGQDFVTNSDDGYRLDLHWGQQGRGKDVAKYITHHPVFGRQLNLGKDGLQLMIRSPELSIKKPGTEKYPTALRVLQAKCPTSLQQVWDQIKSCSENCHMAKLKVTFHNLDRSIMREELSEAILNTANPYTVTLSKPMLHKSPVCRGAEKIYFEVDKPFKHKRESLKKSDANLETLVWAHLLALDGNTPNDFEFEINISGTIGYIKVGSNCPRAGSYELWLFRNLQGVKSFGDKAQIRIEPTCQCPCQRHSSLSLKRPNTGPLDPTVMPKKDRSGWECDSVEPRRSSVARTRVRNQPPKRVICSTPETSANEAVHPRLGLFQVVAVVVALGGICIWFFQTWTFKP